MKIKFETPIIINWNTIISFIVLIAVILMTYRSREEHYRYILDSELLTITVTSDTAAQHAFAIIDSTHHAYDKEVIHKNDHTIIRFDFKDQPGLFEMNHLYHLLGAYHPVYGME